MRDLSKLSKAALVAELEAKHGLDADDLKGTKDELLEVYGGLLDTTTDKEREAAARELCAREAEEAAAAADAVEASAAAAAEGA